MPNENPADEYLAEARDALALARSPEEAGRAHRVHVEAMMLHALGELPEARAEHDQAGTPPPAPARRPWWKFWR